VIRFDQRGSGLSDRNVEDLSFDTWVGDLETVVKANGLEQFVLLGISQGGPVAIEYAVRHPEQVTHLILYGAYARGWVKRGGSLQERQAMLTLMREGWGRDNPVYRQLFTLTFMPEATPEQVRWFNELQRISASAENAVRLRTMSGSIDVSDRLPLVSVPTLVLHARGDESVPFSEGRLLASLIPNARFVALDSRNHLILENEPAWPRLVSEVRAFLSDKNRT
jgi:pimeloyl-ACP methyl ester carboxylesterase